MSAFKNGFRYTFESIWVMDTRWREEISFGLSGDVARNVRRLWRVRNRLIVGYANERPRMPDPQSRFQLGSGSEPSTKMKTKTTVRVSIKRCEYLLQY